MTCPKCQHQTIKKFGTYGAKKIQRFRCKDCGATFAPVQPKPLGAHTTDMDRVVQVLALMTEGMSIRAIARITDIHKTTILSLLATVGTRCAALLDTHLRNLRPSYIQ
ncbi:MAG: transposase-like zinc-binding domain-containing protein, partial [Vicinamibacterales bacterium]